MKSRNIAVACIALLVACTSMADFVAIDDDGLGGVGYAYSIGRTEVSFAEWQLSGISGGNVGNAVNPTNSPVVNISWHRAAQYANWLTSGHVDTGAYTFAAGKVSTVTAHDSAAMDTLVLEHTTVYVLPTEAEWRKAAYWTGSAFSLYANGTSTVPTDEIDAVYDRAIAAGGWAVGNGTEEQNGTLNMMGNVWEFLESTYGGEAYNAANDAQQMAFRGGDYWLGDAFLPETFRAGDLRSGGLNIGIRMVAIPEPGTISLMSLSTMGLFFTRTIRRRRLAGRTLLPVRREHLCDTFLSKEEWEDSAVELVEWEYLAELKMTAKQSLMASWNSVYGIYKAVDTVFWNRMVVFHERRLLRRKAFRAATKKRVVDGFDAFLAFIMK